MPNLWSNWQSSWLDQTCVYVTSKRLISQKWFSKFGISNGWVQWKFKYFPNFRWVCYMAFWELSFRCFTDWNFCMDLDEVLIPQVHALGLYLVNLATCTQYCTSLLFIDPILTRSTFLKNIEKKMILEVFDQKNWEKIIKIARFL